MKALAFTVALAVGLLALSSLMPLVSHAAEHGRVTSGFCPTGTCPEFCGPNNWARNVKNCTAAHCKKCKTENKR